MVFACQRDSFLKEYVSEVVSCTPSELKIGSKSSEPIKGYDVVLVDTILFPEGGGQPCDQGFINDIPVLQVTRKGSEAVHFIEKPLDVGESVKQIVDWDRRLDHMQQHSGQHLISAVIISLFGYETTAWWLGEEVSYVELDTPQMSNDQVNQLEEIVNSKIREGLPVTVTEYQAGDPILKEIRSRGLPEDVAGNIRVVNIKGVDIDMCCGTHVSNLSQVQMIKLIGVEKGKKGKVNLHFLCGGRVTKKLAKLLEREKGLTNLLRNGPDLHLELVDKVQKSAKLLNKNLQNLLKELALKEIEEFQSKVPRPKLYSLHRSDADPDFIQFYIRNLQDKGDTLYFLTIGDEKGAGHMVLYGNEKLVAKYGPEVCAILGGKGNGKGDKFQAKVTNMSKRGEAEQLLQKAVADL